MKTMHGMFAAKPKPTSLSVELNVQIIAVGVCCTGVCLFVFNIPLVNDLCTTIESAYCPSTCFSYLILLVLGVNPKLISSSHHPTMFSLDILYVLL